MSNTPFAYQPALSAISVSYTNPTINFVADRLLPRTTPIATKDFSYVVHPKDEAFNVPITLVGRAGNTQMVDFTSGKVNTTHEDYGLETPFYRVDELSSTDFNIRAKGVERLTKLMLLAREVRVVNTFTDTATYAAGYSAALTGTAQWSDYVNSDPVLAIKLIKDTFIGFEPNKFWMTKPVWTVLSMHPKIVNAVRGVVANSGMITREQFAALIEVDEVIVVNTWRNTAAPGLTPVYARLAGKNAGMFYQDTSADQNGGTTFGYTSQWGQSGGIRQALEYFDVKQGVRGADVVRIMEPLRELIIAGDLGYLWQTAVA